MIDPLRLAFSVLFSLLLLVGLITRWRCTPFIALVLAALTLTITSGIDFSIAWKAFLDGVGGMLGSTALVIGLGAILGALLAESGGARVIAEQLTERLGGSRIKWSLFIAGILVGLGTWFTVGLVLLTPVLFSFLHVTERRLLPASMAMLAALSAMHGLAPPHPGPLAAIGLLEADVGRTIFWSLVVGVPAAMLVGPMWKRWERLPIDPAPTGGSVTPQRTPTEPTDSDPSRSLGGCREPHWLEAISCVLFPVVLMMASTVATVMHVREGSLKAWLTFFGEPTVAMLTGVLLAYWLLGSRCGRGREECLRVTERGLVPVANVLLVVGAGAGFSKVLIATGAAQNMTEIAVHWKMHPLIVGWLTAALIRVATGSATTAITTASGLVLPLVIAHPETNRELMVMAMGAGSLTLSHVNDGGFWFVKEYFGLTIAQTLRSWTVLETVFSVVALLLTFLFDVWV